MKVNCKHCYHLLDRTDPGVGVSPWQRTTGIRPPSAAGPTHRTAVAQGKPERDDPEAGQMASRVASTTMKVRRQGTEFAARPAVGDIGDRYARRTGSR
ncbi:hypothetical protein F01_460074 [Burkholderia cenocepacia]|nr:hypothetical protein F01_460074 [Burkholderia cenocepacia]